MGRRMLDNSLWSNENFAALPPRGRLLQIGMITIADDQGRLKAHPLFLAKEIFPYDHMEASDVSKWLALMEQNGTIQLYTVDGKQYAQFLNWWDYQSLQFAHASSYPRPDGWQDRLRFNSKGNQMMVSNWTTPKGDRLVDTCDQEGKLFPFVMELPVNRAANSTDKVPTKVRTLVPTQAPTEARTQVTSQLPNYQLPTKEEEGESNGAKAPARPPSLKDHPLIRAFYEQHNRYPNREQMAEIVRLNPPLPDWIRAIHAWAMAGNRPTNVQGMLDWAFDPARFEDHHAPAKAAGKEQHKTGYGDYNYLLAPLPDRDAQP